jgi:hypothetical protein
MLPFYQLSASFPSLHVSDSPTYYVYLSFKLYPGLSTICDASSPTLYTIDRAVNPVSRKFLDPKQYFEREEAYQLDSQHFLQLFSSYKFDGPRVSTLPDLLGPMVF